MGDRQLHPTDRDPFELEFARRLKAARRATGLSAADFADRAGIALSAISAYEAGRRMPRFTGSNQLAIALGYSGLAELLTACHRCMNRPRTGAVCGACGLPETPKAEIPPVEVRAYARLRETILGGDRP